MDAAQPLGHRDDSHGSAEEQQTALAEGWGSLYPPRWFELRMNDLSPQIDDITPCDRDARSATQQERGSIDQCDSPELASGL